MKIADVESFFKGERLILERSSGDFRLIAPGDVRKTTDLRAPSDLCKDNNVTRLFFQQLEEKFETYDDAWMSRLEFVIKSLENIDDPSDLLMTSLEKIYQIKDEFFKSIHVLKEDSPSFLKKSVEFVKTSILNDPSTFRFIDESLLVPLSFLQELVSINHQVFHYFPERIKDNEMMQLCFMAISTSIFDLLPERLKESKEFALRALEKNVDLWPKLDKRFTENEDFIEEALKCQGEILKYLKDHAKNERLSLIALNSPAFYVFNHLDESLKSSLDFTQKALKVNPWIYKLLKKEFQQDYECALITIEKDIYLFDDLLMSLQTNLDFRLLAVKTNPGCIERMYDYLDLATLDRYVYANPRILDHLLNSFDHFALDLNQMIKTFFKTLETQAEPSLDLSLIQEGCLHLRNLKLKLELMYECAKLTKIALQQTYARFQTLTCHFTHEQNARLALCLWLVASLHIEHSDLQKIASLIKAHYRDLKDAGRMNAFLHVLIDLKQTTLDDHKRKELIIGLFENGDFKTESILKMRYISALKHLNQEALSGPLEMTSKALGDCLVRIAKECGLVAEHIIDAEKKLSSSFLASRSPAALFTYFALHKTDPIMKSVIKEFVGHVLEGTFNTFRQEHNSHLLHMTEKQAQMWQQEVTLDLGGGLMLHDTASWEDLFLAGSDISSCLRVDGSSRLNRCLMGYVMDGKVRLLAVKNASGKIIARKMCKILLDGDGRPCVYVDPRTYGHSEYEGVIHNAALSKARLLGSSLYTAHDEGEVSLDSYGSYAPYEYDDSDSGVTEGAYCVTATIIAQ